LEYVNIEDWMALIVTVLATMSSSATHMYHAGDAKHAEDMKAFDRSPRILIVYRNIAGFQISYINILKSISS
jgi:hypothetical protein